MSHYDRQSALEALDDGFAPASIAARAWKLTERQLHRKARHGLIRRRWTRSGIAVFELPAPVEDAAR